MLPWLSVQKKLVLRSRRLVRIADAPGLGLLRFRLEKARVGMVLSADLALAAEGSRATLPISARAAGVLRMFGDTGPSVRACEVDVSDGDRAAPGVVGFCSADPRSILVPDHDFFQTRGHEALRRFAAAHRTDWADRSPVVLWRGSTTGEGGASPGGLAAGAGADPDGAAAGAGDAGGLLPRVRMCLALRDEPGVDVRISSLVRGVHGEADRAWLAARGVLGEALPVETWAGHRLAIDVDGNTNAWANLFQRLLLGCCVIKVGSPRGFRQWYYADLVPGVHYVPVRPDLSDLVDVVRWCRANDAACRDIAAAGQRLAEGMTFAREMRRGTEAIEAGAVSPPRPPPPAPPPGRPPAPPRSGA